MSAKLRDCILEVIGKDKRLSPYVKLLKDTDDANIQKVFEAEIEPALTARFIGYNKTIPQQKEIVEFLAKGPNTVNRLKRVIDDPSSKLGGFQSLSSKINMHERLAHSTISKLLVIARPNIYRAAGLQNNRLYKSQSTKALHTFNRELFNADTKNVHVLSVQKANADLNKKYNDSRTRTKGAKIDDRFEWNPGDGLPLYKDPMRIAKVSKEEFLGDAAKYIKNYDAVKQDVDKLWNSTKYTDDLGLGFQDNLFRPDEDTAFNFKFNDYDSWLAFNKKYGVDANPNSMDVIEGMISRLAHRTAFTDIFGLDYKNTVTKIKNKVFELGEIRGEKAVPHEKSMVEALIAKYNFENTKPDNIAFANIDRGYRLSLINLSLPLAAIDSIFLDPVFKTLAWDIANPSKGVGGKLARPFEMLGMTSLEFGKNMWSLVKPWIKGLSKDEAREAYIMLGGAIGDLAQRNRTLSRYDADAISLTSKDGRISRGFYDANEWVSFMMSNLSSLADSTQSIRNSSVVMFSKLMSKTFNKGKWNPDDNFVKELSSIYGFTKDDFDILANAPKYSQEANKQAQGAINVTELYTKGNAEQQATAMKYWDFIYKMEQTAVPVSTATSSVLITRNTKPGTISRAATGSAAMLKNFLFSRIMTYFNTLGTKYVKEGAGWSTRAKWTGEAQRWGVMGVHTATLAMPFAYMQKVLRDWMSGAEINEDYFLNNKEAQNNNWLWALTRSGTLPGVADFFIEPMSRGKLGSDFSAAAFIGETIAGRPAMNIVSNIYDYATPERDMKRTDQITKHLGDIIRLPNLWQINAIQNRGGLPRLSEIYLEAWYGDSRFERFKDREQKRSLRRRDLKPN